MQNVLLNLTVLGFLFLLFATMLRERGSRRLRFWTFAWLLLLMNGALALVQAGNPRVWVWLQMAHLELLILAATFFLISLLDGPVGMVHGPRIGAMVAVPWVAVTLWVVVVPHATKGVAMCVVAGQMMAMGQALRIAGRACRVGILVACGVMAAMMLALAGRHAQRVPEMAVAELLLANAILLWTNTLRDGRESAEKTTGVMATCLGLAGWAALFPMAAFFGHLMPRFVVSPMAWSLPQFLVAFGMLLMLHEDDVSRANEMSEKYRMLFDRHPLPMWVFHAETLRFLMVNDAAVANYGYTREQFQSMTIRDIRPAEELDRLERVLETPSRTLNRTSGWKHILADGRRIEVDIFSHWIDFERLPARIVVAIDATSRNAAEEKLRQAHKLESLGQLTGGVAHDFNNILAIILGNLELIERTVTLDGQGEQMVRQAKASVNRGSELTRRLLAYAMQQPLEPRTVALPRLLEDTVRFIQSTMGPMIEVVVGCDPLLWDVRIDPGQLENALLNLAVNARDAMGESGVLRIGCRNVRLEEAEMRGEYVELTVRDNGVGMPAEVLARATEPFFTTKPVGKGTGLGLSMVYGFLKQSGGHVQMTSRMHAGTTVTMYLPRGVAGERRSGVRPAGEIPVGGEKILVVEDEHAIRVVLAQVLRSLGYGVLEAEDGPGAMEHLKATPGIDLLLTDVVLPNGTSGGLLAVDAKALQPEIKVLFSSGYTRNALIRDRRLEEGVHLLTKPFRLAELAATVRRVLDDPS